MILNHYPPVIKQIKDIQQIAKAEDIEFTKLNTSITEVIRNMFVFTADETGVKRFEKLLGITPKAAQSLDDRKIYIISMMNRRKMSLEELTAMLSNYSEGIRLINDMSNFEMIVEINTDAGSLETINSIIDEILPLNIYFEFALQRETTIKYKLEDLIFMAFEPAAGENEHCNFDNNITAIKKADYTQSVAGFSYVNSYENAGAFVCGVECCLAMQAPKRCKHRNSHRGRNNTDKNVRRRKRNNRGRYTIYNGRKRGNGARGRNGNSYAVKNMRHRLRKRGGLKC